LNRTTLALMVLFTAPGFHVAAQQRADTGFEPDVPAPRWSPGQGPRAAVDEAHHNFHTADGRYRPFVELLRADGWNVDSSSQPFTAAALDGVDVLIVANALNERNAQDWSLPTPSAFTDEEIAVVLSWVREGGALLLIADHMPMPGAAEALGRAFGFEMRNGFAAEPPGLGTIVFRRADGTLTEHAITAGRGEAARIDSVATFVGQGFKPPEDAHPLLVFRGSAVSLEPDTAWQFHDATPEVDLGGWSQGAVLQAGRGRVAVFGEAAAFTAQVGGPDGAPMGLNTPVAAQNARFILNVMAWLVGEPD